MNISSDTLALVEKIEKNANRQLRFRLEVAQLLELAYKHESLNVLEDLSFHAKFAYKVHGMMQRIGRDADGYEKLLREFGESVSTAKRLATDLLKHSPEVSTHFDSQFFSLTPVAFQDLLSLFRDLSCYKNYLIDTPAKQSLS